MSELFEPQKQRLREKLVARGWRQVGGLSAQRQQFWLRPIVNAMMAEDEAFQHLERLEKQEAEVALKKAEADRGQVAQQQGGEVPGEADPR